MVPQLRLFGAITGAILQVKDFAQAKDMAHFVTTTACFYAEMRAAGWPRGGPPRGPRPPRSSPPSRGCGGKACRPAAGGDGKSGCFEAGTLIHLVAEEDPEQQVVENNDALRLLAGAIVLIAVSPELAKLYRKRRLISGRTSAWPIV